MEPTTHPAFVGPLAAPWLALHAGRVRLANAQMAQIARAPEEMTPAQWALLAALTVEARLAVGDIPAAAAAADPLASYCSQADPTTAANAHLGLGELAAALGDQAGALSHHLAAGELGATDAIRPWRVGAALALVRLGRRHEGADLARAQVRLATSPHDRANGLRALAIAESGNDPVGVLQEALTTAAGTPDRRLVAQLQTDIAGLMLLAPYRYDAGEAVALLREAEAYAATEGLWPLHTRITKLLERSGERPRPLEGEALALLTPAERRVAQLAATGMTNREIAETLQVTVKGVEWHLSRVYRKLGIGSREGLAQLFNAGELAS